MWHTAIVTATEFENFFKQRCPQYEFNGVLYRSREDIFNEYSQNELLKKGCPNREDNLGWLKLNKGGAEIHIMGLAEQMWDAMNESTPKQLKAGEWHIPFGDNIDEEKILQLLDSPKEVGKQVENIKVKIAVARCARVSYMNYDGTDDYEKDIKLYDRLSGMRHWSPFEHVARAMSKKEMDSYTRTIPAKDDGSKLFSYGWCGNFQGFIQARKTFQGESGI